MIQMKEEKYPEKELKEMEATMLPDAGCKTLIKMLRELRETMDELNERNK